MKDLVLLGDRDPRAFTHQELDVAIELLPSPIRARWVPTDSAEAGRVSDADGVWVVPGSPYRNDAAVYAAIGTARVTGQPFLGTCGGFQYVAVEFARNVAGLTSAAHAETSPDAQNQVVHRLACSLVGQERLVTVVPGTKLAELCGDRPFLAFHWCNYGLVSSFLPALARHGLVVSARSDDAGVEGVELQGHPFFLATLFQPQVGASSFRQLHPVIRGLADAI